MHKLILRLEDLTVSSFVTSPSSHGYGTVISMSTPAVETVIVLTDVCEDLAGLFTDDAGGSVPVDPAPDPVNVPVDGALPAQVPGAVARNPILIRMWNLAKAIAPTALQQGAAFGAMYGATVAASNQIKNSNMPVCLSAYIAGAKTKYESTFGAGSFTPKIEQEVYQYCLEFPNMYNATC